MPFYIFAPNYNETYGNEQPQPVPSQQAPVVVINQNFVPDSPRPSVREYPAGSLPEPPPKNVETKSIDDEKPTVYLIAMKDSTIYSSLAYWVEDNCALNPCINTLHYITTQHSHNRATVDLIDRDLSIQLNRERGVEFNLPAR